MPDQRSVMKEFRALEQKRQVAGLTPEEAKRHAALRDLVGSEGAAPARGGFDVSAAAARLRESLLPAGLRSRPPEAGLPAAPPAAPEPAAPPVEPEAAPPGPQPWAPLPGAGPEAASLDTAPAPWPEPVVEPVAEALPEALAEPVAEPAGEPPVTAAAQLFDPASLAREPKPQAWNPEAPGYDPDAPYDEEAWIAAGYDPNVTYDWSAYGAGPEAQAAGAASDEAAPVQEAGAWSEGAPVEAAPVEAAPVEAAPVEAAPVEASTTEAWPGEAIAVEAPPGEAIAPEPLQPGTAEEPLPFDPEAPFDHAKWFGRAATAGGTAPGEAMAWGAGAPDASPDAALDAPAPEAPPLVLGEYDELAAAAPPPAAEGLDALAEPTLASPWPEEPGTPPAAPPSSPPAFGEYDELAAGPGIGGAPELPAAAGTEPSPTFDAAPEAAVATEAPPEGYEFLGMPGEPATPAEGEDAAVEVAPAPEPPEELPGGPPLAMGEPPPEWQAETVLDQGFQLASDGSFGMIEPSAAPATQAFAIPQPVPTASPAEEGWSSPPALDLAAPFEQPTLTPAEPMAAWRPEPEELQAASAPAEGIVPPLDLDQPGGSTDLAPTTGSGPAFEALEAAPVLEELAQAEPVQPPGPATAVEPAPQEELAPPEELPGGEPLDMGEPSPPVDLAPPLQPAPVVGAAWPAEAPVADATPATAGAAQAAGDAAGPATSVPGPDEELPTLEVEELLEEVATEPVEPPRPLDFGPPAAEPGSAEAPAFFPAEVGAEVPAAAEEPLLVPVEAVAEAPLLEPIATPAPAIPPPPPVQAPQAAAAASASPPPLWPAVPLPPIPAPAAAAAPSRVVVHTVDGQVRRGLLSSADLGQPQLVLTPQVAGSPELIPADSVKAIFFMLAPGETPPPPQGRKVRVTFRDGRQVAGYSPDFQEGTVGFFMIPADTRTNTARIWVYQAAVRQVALS